MKECIKVKKIDVCVKADIRFVIQQCNEKANDSLGH